MSYKAFVLLPDASGAMLANAKDILSEALADDEFPPKFKMNEDMLVIRFGKWKCYLWYNAKPHVLIESKEMADRFAKKRKDKNDIAKSAQRFEISSEADRKMDHFNDYLSVLEILGGHYKGKIWEDASQTFMD